MGKYQIIYRMDKAILDLGSLALRIVRAPSLAADSGRYKRNIELKQYKSNERCYILALGPSLRDVDFNKLDGDTIAVNRFSRMQVPDDFQPTFYCLADAAFYTGAAKADAAHAIERFDKSVFVFNGKYSKEIEREFPAQPKKSYFIRPWKGFVKSSEEIDFTKDIPLTGNVACLAIMLALFAGYKEIILLGCDFNSFASRSSVHSYDEDNTSRLIDLSFELFCYSFVADAHQQLNDYAIRHGATIINATPGSLIDAYPYRPEIGEGLSR